MVRNYKKKRERVIDEQDVKTAILQVITGRMKLRQAANIYNIKPSTLHHRVTKYKNDIPLKSKDFTTKYTVAQIFTKEEEEMLKKYLLQSSEMNYGLTNKQARQLAYQYASALKKCPEKWTKNREAGIEWLKGFMKRNNELLLRKPKNASLSTVKSFDKYDVAQFFDNYAKVLRKYGFTPDKIYNLVETNIMTVVEAADVVARSEANQEGQCASAEQGQLITMCGIGNALGNFIPPVFILPVPYLHDSMIRGGPLDCVGYANSSTSGSMTGPLFIKVLEHIRNTVKSSYENPILLLMDNHESHCTLEAIKYCRENGIVVVTFPPHCGHRFQPLDLAVNGPFKQKLAVAKNDWLVNHPGKTITIEDLVGIVTSAYNVTYIARNMVAGFAIPGIHPLARNVFPDDEFECAELTNRSPPQAPSISAETISELTQHSPVVPTATEDDDKTNYEESDTKQEINVNDDSPVTASTYLSTTKITTVQIKTFPKAEPRIQSNKSIRKTKNLISTDTPEIDDIQKVYHERQVDVGKHREKISGQKKRKCFNLAYSESSSSKGSKLKTARRKKTKSIHTYSSDETETEMDLGSENELIEDSEENLDMTDCEHADCEKELDCAVLNPENFMVAQVSSKNNKRSSSLPEVTKPRLATSSAKMETNKENHTNALTEESMSSDSETFVTKKENSYLSNTIESNNGEDEIAFEDVKLEAPSYRSFMSITGRDVINVAPETLVWTKKLNSLHPTVRLYVEKAINDIIFEAELGNISKDSVKINGK